MNAVIYARYSSHSQNEMSIEGQIAECLRYAKEHDLVILQEYIDRAQSATTDKRPEFLRMIDDSYDHNFEIILVYQFDRFARNKNDSGYYKKILADNGVKVISAKEQIADDSSGVITEGILEIFADYFSKQNAEKVTRGMRQNAEKCKYNGGNMTYGYAIDSDGYYILDNERAPIVKEIFERVAEGETVKSIMDDLNNRGVKSATGKTFVKNSLQNLLRNEKYKGIYIYSDIRIPGGIPRIVSDELFDEVQNRIGRHPSAHRPATEDYLLTGKAFCGHCKEPMIGTSGTSKTGKIYRYYKCSKSPSKCDKKNVSKDLIEELVFKTCRDHITDELIDMILESVRELNEQDQESLELIRLRKDIKETETKIERLVDQIENGTANERVSERLNQREEELKLLNKRLSVEKAKQLHIDPDTVRMFLRSLRHDEHDEYGYMAKLIKLFVDKIYLYDDHFRILLNYSGNKGKTGKEAALEIEEYFDKKSSNTAHIGPPQASEKSEVFSCLEGVEFSVVIELFAAHF